MKPIEAEVHYKEIEKDENNKPVFEKDTPVMKEVVARGIITDIITMRDKTENAEVDEAYALFFEDKGEYSTPSLERLDTIRVPSGKMRTYVNSFYE